MWETDNLFQLTAFLRSGALGALLCLAYDVLRAERRALKPGAVAIFFQDIVFSVLSALAVFCFLLAVTGGDMRAYVALGAAAGFFCCRYTLSRPWLWILVATFKLLRRISVGAASVSAATRSRFNVFFDTLGAKIRAFFKFLANSLKKCLKKAV